MAWGDPPKCLFCDFHHWNYCFQAIEALFLDQPKGWICPVCGSGLSPEIKRCPCLESSLVKQIALAKP